MNKQEILNACTVIGNIVKLPDGQLSRELYQQIKTDLEKIGGKWKGGKIMGFVFQEDPSDLLSDIISGKKRNIKKEFQFFATPDYLADKMVKYAEVDIIDRILEPSAGQGAIINAIHKIIPNAIIDCYEAMPLNQKVLKFMQGVSFIGDDFMKAKDDLYDIIIANPPFTKKQDIDHIRKMFSMLRPGGRLVTLCSPNYQYLSDTKSHAFMSWLKEIRAVIEEIPKGTFKESGTSIKTILIVIDKW